MNDFVLDDTINTRSVLSLNGIERSFRQGRQTLEILKGVSLKVTAGEIVALVGPSGAGKSTLLHIAGLLENPDTGEITICDENCEALNDAEFKPIALPRIFFSTSIDTKTNLTG